MQQTSLEAALAQARALMRERRMPEALTLLRSLVAAHPQQATPAFLLGVALAEQRDFTAARTTLERAFVLDSRQPAPNRLVFANVLHDAGDPAGAEAQARQALQMSPAWPPALNALGLALRAQGRTDEAIAAFRATLQAQPGHAPAHRHLARLLHQRAALGEAIEHYRHALALADGDADLWNEFGVALTDAGLLAEARAAYRECLARRPSYHQVESNLLVNLHYDPSIDAETMFAAHRDWARRHAAHLRPRAWPRSAGRPARLRVGFLSPAFTAGPTASCLRPLLLNLDPARFEPIAFNVGRTDDTSAVLRNLTAGWHDLWEVADEEVATRIAGERIDILVDLAGHTPGGRPLALARKPAPVIATWLDYFDTTGLDAVDYLVGDPTSTPPQGPQRFTERVVRIEPARLCYQPPDYAPNVAPPPAARNGNVTFGSFNRYSKIAAPVIELWSRLLRKVPGSRLLIKNAALTDAAMRERLLGAFKAHGVDGDRLDLRGPSPHASMLAEYGDMDVALDTFPYNGGLTTCEALWMGAPVVTLLGNAMISRQSAALLQAAGMPEFIAADGDGFLSIAADLVADPARLAALRSSMRARLRASPLMDGARFTRQFEAALDAMGLG